MKQLEAVYLANVILYMNSVETIIKLIQVNKKCQEASKIIRIYDQRKIHEKEEEEKYNYVVIKNVFELFPNIETIRCRYQDIHNNLDLFKKVKQIELKYFSSNKIELEKTIKDKIICLNIICFSLENNYLSDFPNVKNVKIEYWNDGFLKQFLGDNTVYLKKLVIHAKNREELTILTNYKNIDNKIIKIRDKITKERFNELTSFAVVRAQHQIVGMDIKETLCVFNDLRISKECDIKQLNELSLFTKCYIENDFDLRGCELLEEVFTSFYNKNLISIKINGLKHLKRMGYIGDVDVFPSSLTNLSFDPSFVYKELLKNNIDCFKNVKVVKLKINKIDDFVDAEVFLNFNNCSHIELFNENETLQEFKFPINVRELFFTNFIHENQINEIAKATKLKKLSLHFNINKEKQRIQKMYDNLVQLEWLKTDFVDDINPPPTITFLDLEVKKNTNLGQFTSLKEIKLSGCFDCCQVKLPNKLNKLYIHGDIAVENSKEIDIDRVILINNKSNPSHWKSKNLYFM